MHSIQTGTVTKRLITSLLTAAEYMEVEEDEKLSEQSSQSFAPLCLPASDDSGGSEATSYKNVINLHVDEENDSDSSDSDISLQIDEDYTSPAPNPNEVEVEILTGDMESESSVESDSLPKSPCSDNSFKRSGIVSDVEKSETPKQDDFVLAENQPSSNQSQKKDHVVNDQLNVAATSSSSSFQVSPEPSR